MTDAIVPQLTARFDELSQRLPDENIEFWFARDLMEPLGYARWENFITAIHRAIESCKSTGYNESDHFRGVTKMVKLGSGAERPVDDFMLTRYACYLIAQNGDMTHNLTPKNVTYDVVDSFERLMEVVK